MKTIYSDCSCITSWDYRFKYHTNGFYVATLPNEVIENILKAYDLIIDEDNNIVRRASGMSMGYIKT